MSACFWPALARFPSAARLILAPAALLAALLLWGDEPVARAAKTPELPPEAAQRLQSACGRTQVYGCYTNHKYGFAVAWPKAYLSPQGESDDGGGQVFSIPDGRATLTAWAMYNDVIGQSLKELFVEGAAQEGLNLSYQHLGKDFFVISGMKDRKIFYRKTVIAGDIQASFEFSYDPSLKEAFDPIVKDVAASFTVHPALAWRIK